MNQLVTAFLPPQRPAQARSRRTAASRPSSAPRSWCPTLFGSVEAVSEALENLEVQFLANREAHLHFAVLSDFTDAPTETRRGRRRRSSPPRSTGVRGAERAVRARRRRTPFYLFHRPRRWNPQRGRVDGLGAEARQAGRVQPLPRPAARRARSRPIVGRRRARSAAVRYVITLDADTVLPPDAAPLLIGALAHPLNRAVYDPPRGRVVRGYGILQPRVGVSLPSAHRSRFAAIHSGHPGVDPYTTAVSDVYQDLYGEGSFTGKGIYDVDAFERATHGRFPENTLLSHDLIEGNYARAGLVTDIKVYDDYPGPLPHLHPAQAPLDPRRLAAAALARRPGAADPTAPSPTGSRCSRAGRSSTTCAAARSSRRSCCSCSPAGRCSPALRCAGPLLGLGAIAAPLDRRPAARGAPAAARQVLARLLRGGRPATRRPACSSSRSRSPSCRTRPGSRSTPSSARCGGSCVSRRKLLEWQTASQTERMVCRRRPRPSGARCGPRWPCGVGLARRARPGAALIRGGTRALDPLVGAALPLAGLWLARPWIAHALSAPAARRERRLPRASRRPAMRYALLHWRFFDRFVDRGDPLARARTTSRRIRRRWWRCAPRPPTSACSCWPRSARYDLGFITARRHGRAARADLRHARADCGASAATSTTGTTCTTCGCWSRPTSPPWTAATSPDTSSRCARRCLALPDRARCSTGGVPRALAAPALALAAGARGARTPRSPSALRRGAGRARGPRPTRCVLGAARR